jgi:Bifunctional DNA primase/polymerase, N-terminal
MMAYMLHDPSMNGRPANDVDIGFLNEMSYAAFLGDLRSLLHSIDLDLKSRGIKLTYETQYPSQPYAFNNLISDKPDNQLNIDIRIYREAPVWTNGTMKLHMIVLDDSVSAVKDATNQEQQIGRLFKHFFKFDYLRVVYYNRQVHSKLNHINDVVLSARDQRTNVALGFISKYSRRGIRFSRKGNEVVNLEESKSTILEVSYDQMIPFAQRLLDAKNKYNAFGLAVIPLSKNDKNRGGKAPKCADWANKTSSFNFDTTKCDNIGIVCGNASGICCIDVDAKDNGVHYFNKLARNYGLPSCPTQETPNGGYHYIFKYNPARMDNMKFVIKGARINGEKIGIDLWIRKCQFVAAPSVNHEVGKAYRWTTPLSTRDAIPELPEWIYDLYRYKDITEEGIIIKNDNRPPSEISSNQSTTSGLTSAGTSEASSASISTTPSTNISHSVSNPPMPIRNIANVYQPSVAPTEPTTVSFATNESITIADITSLNWVSLSIAPIIALFGIIIMVVFMVMMMVVWLSFPPKLKDVIKHIFCVLFSRAINSFM